MDTAQHMLATSTESSLNRIRDSIRSVVAGAGLFPLYLPWWVILPQGCASKRVACWSQVSLSCGNGNAAQVLEQGWHDLDAERAIIGAALGESALKVITTCQVRHTAWQAGSDACVQNSGLRSIDFKDKVADPVRSRAETVNRSTNVFGKQQKK